MGNTWGNAHRDHAFLPNHRFQRESDALRRARCPKPLLPNLFSSKHLAPARYSQLLSNTGGVLCRPNRNQYGILGLSDPPLKGGWVAQCPSTGGRSRLVGRSRGWVGGGPLSTETNCTIRRPGCQVLPRTSVQESRQRPHTVRSLTRRFIVAAQHPPGDCVLKGFFERPIGLPKITSRTIGLNFNREHVARSPSRAPARGAEATRTITSSMMGSFSSPSRLSASLRPRRTAWLRS